jgi:excisionase family DNA binding protein
MALLTASEAATILGVSRQMVYQYVRKKRLKTRPLRAVKGFSLAEVKQLKEQRKARS